MPVQSKFKKGQKVRIPSANLEGVLVEIYFDAEHNANAYVICSVKLDAPDLQPPKSLEDIHSFIESIPSKITTKLVATTVRLDSEEEMEVVN